MEPNADKFQEAIQKQQVEAMKKSILLRYMTKQARERLNRVKLVKPEVAEKVELALMQALQMGQIKDRLTDVQLKDILVDVSNSKNFNLKTSKR